MQTISPNMSPRILKSISEGNVEVMFMAITLRFRPWQKCIADPSTFTVTVQVGSDI